ncbi:hypothetical protein BGZ83_001547 [Gryganskiella cystojenkinii]|nr:hypothetical protein BGZ83_001547 [Gryganskiella cystojenkinii]
MNRLEYIIPALYSVAPKQSLILDQAWSSANHSVPKSDVLIQLQTKTGLQSMVIRYWFQCKLHLDEIDTALDTHKGKHVRFPQLENFHELILFTVSGSCYCDQTFDDPPSSSTLFSSNTSTNSNSATTANTAGTQRTSRQQLSVPRLPDLLQSNTLNNTKPEKSKSMTVKRQPSPSPLPARPQRQTRGLSSTHDFASATSSSSSNRPIQKPGVQTRSLRSRVRSPQQPPPLVPVPHVTEPDPPVRRGRGRPRGSGRGGAAARGRGRGRGLDTVYATRSSRRQHNGDQRQSQDHSYVNTQSTATNTGSPTTRPSTPQPTIEQYQQPVPGRGRGLGLGKGVGSAFLMRRPNTQNRQSSHSQSPSSSDSSSDSGNSSYKSTRSRCRNRSKSPCRKTRSRRSDMRHSRGRDQSPDRGPASSRDRRSPSRSSGSSGQRHRGHQTRQSSLSSRSNRSRQNSQSSQSRSSSSDSGSSSDSSGSESDSDSDNDSDMKTFTKHNNRHALVRRVTGAKTPKITIKLQTQEEPVVRERGMIIFSEDSKSDSEPSSQVPEVSTVSEPKSVSGVDKSPEPSRILTPNQVVVRSYETFKSNEFSKRNESRMTEEVSSITNRTQKSNGFPNATEENPGVQDTSNTFDFSCTEASSRYFAPVVQVAVKHSNMNGLSRETNTLALAIEIESDKGDGEVGAGSVSTKVFLPSVAVAGNSTSSGVTMAATVPVITSDSDSDEVSLGSLPTDKRRALRSPFAHAAQTAPPPKQATPDKMTKTTNSDTPVSMQTDAANAYGDPRAGDQSRNELMMNQRQGRAPGKDGDSAVVVHNCSDSPAQATDDRLTKTQRASLAPVPEKTTGVLESDWRKQYSAITAARRATTAATPYSGGPKMKTEGKPTGTVNDNVNNFSYPQLLSSQIVPDKKQIFRYMCKIRAQCDELLKGTPTLSLSSNNNINNTSITSTTTGASSSITLRHNLQKRHGSNLDHYLAPTKNGPYGPNRGWMSLTSCQPDQRLQKRARVDYMDMYAESQSIQGLVRPSTINPGTLEQVQRQRVLERQGQPLENPFHRYLGDHRGQRQDGGGQLKRQERSRDQQSDLISYASQSENCESSRGRGRERGRGGRFDRSNSTSTQGSANDDYGVNCSSMLQSPHVSPAVLSLVPSTAENEESPKLVISPHMTLIQPRQQKEEEEEKDKQQLSSLSLSSNLPCSTIMSNGNLPPTVISDGSFNGGSMSDVEEVLSQTGLEDRNDNALSLNNNWSDPSKGTKAASATVPTSSDSTATSATKASRGGQQGPVVNGSQVLSPAIHDAKPWF